MAGRGAPVRKEELMLTDAEKFAQLCFSDAVKIWLEERKSKLRPRTYEVYVSYANQVKKFFSETVLWQLDANMIRAYQKSREGTVAASAVNHEVECVLGPVLQRAGLWQRLKPGYERVPMRGWEPPKVMSEDDEDRLFKIAASNADWSVAYWVSSITCNTSASGQELRMLRLRDVDLDAEDPKFRVPPRGAKNRYRERVIPMNEVALKQFVRVVERARKLGACHGDHYIFPFRDAPNRYDVTRPASPSFLRNSFRNLRIAAGMPWLTPHCFRHQSITKMLEAGVPEQTVMAVAGHVSRQMLEHYSHTRIQAKRQALSMIAPKGKAKNGSRG